MWLNILYAFRNGVLRLAEGKFCRLYWLTAAVSQIRCNNGCINRCQSAIIPISPHLSHEVCKIPSSLASSEIIWFEMLRTDHRISPSEVSKWPAARTFLLFSIISPWNGMVSSAIPHVSFVVLLHAPKTHLTWSFFGTNFPQTQVNMWNTESPCSQFDVTFGPRTMPC